MTDDETADAMVRAGRLIETAVIVAAQLTGLPVPLVLAAAHAEVVGMIAVMGGGPMAAQACERAADRVRDFPDHSRLALAVAPAQGRA
jgi:hypothetical protein